jgi:hypothetical protein
MCRTTSGTDHAMPSDWRGVSSTAIAWLALLLQLWPYKRYPVERALCVCSAKTTRLRTLIINHSQSSTRPWSRLPRSACPLNRSGRCGARASAEKSSTALTQVSSPAAMVWAWEKKDHCYYRSCIVIHLTTSAAGILAHPTEPHRCSHHAEW